MEKEKTYVEQWEEAAKKDAKYYIATGYHHSEQYYNSSGIASAGDLVRILNPIYKNEIRNKTIIDLGCGNGRVTKYLADVFRMVIGVDGSETMIMKSKERIKSKNVSWLLNKGGNIALPDSSIDIIYSYVVFHHCKEDTILKHFKEVERILKPDGYFVFQLPIEEKHKEPEEFNWVCAWTKNELRKPLVNFKEIHLDLNHFGLHIYKKK